MSESKPVFEKILERPFLRYGKVGYRAVLSDLPEGNRVGAPTGSRLTLSEDGRRCDPPHRSIASVSAHGNGQYVHWKDELYFSSTDNSDVNLNGRTYRIVWSDALYYESRADYFYRMLVLRLRTGGLTTDDLKGRRLLEVGCDRHQGLSLMAVGFGADVVGVDGYAPAWDPSFHPGFIDYLMEKGPSLWAGFDAPRLETIRRAEHFDATPFVFFQKPAEEIARYVSDPFDLQMSCSVLEHFCDMDRVAEMLFEMGAPGCMGLHFVDFSDHRDFTNPLDFLLMDDEAYDTLSGDHKYVYGNRLRPMEFMNLWKRHGFSRVDDVAVSLGPDPGYLSSFVPRLRASGTRFAQEPAETLARLAIDYVTYKEGAF